MMFLCKVWTYELFFDRWGGDDAWDADRSEYLIKAGSVAH
jgi:hypothetical protein